eukprot:TRINITY_DN19218_c0_g1_i1.p1 TRINITY_DN19218_c0_g1~~TRINITY_DN19218_c0_g1_i1.p1  ORF type:complete len:226 (+),score=19.63 TRINITY_DN19218_c0_g1_i1:38-715(+)
MFSLLSISSSLGMAAVIGFAVSAFISSVKLWDEPIQRPSGVILIILLLADVSNLVGCVMAEVPTWQMIVAVVFIFGDMIYSIALLTMDEYQATELVTPALRRALFSTIILVFLFAVSEMISSHQSTSRTVVIQLGIVSAVCNISVKLWRSPGRFGPPSVSQYINIVSQAMYSLAIISHPDNSKGRSYLEESAPWLVGSVVPALLEYNAVVEQTFRQKKDNARHVI